MPTASRHGRSRRDHECVGPPGSLFDSCSLSSQSAWCRRWLCPTLSRTIHTCQHCPPSLQVPPTRTQVVPTKDVRWGRAAIAPTSLGLLDARSSTEPAKIGCVSEFSAGPCGRWHHRPILDSRHSLRPSAVMNVYRVSRDLFLAQRFARHVSPLTTTVYTHPADEEFFSSIKNLSC